MKKNNYISLVLLFVFSFMLVHNVIPHHHHDDISEINNHEHEHHHDKKEKDHDHENDEPIGSFSHPTHIASSTEFIYSNYHSSQKTQNVNKVARTSNFILKQIIVSIKQDPPDYFSVVTINHLHSTPSLRGPPVLSV